MYAITIHELLLGEYIFNIFVYVLKKAIKLTHFCCVGGTVVHTFLP